MSEGKKRQVILRLVFALPNPYVVQFEAEPEAEQWHQCFLPMDPEAEKEWVDLKELQAEAYDAIEDPPSARPPPTTGTE